MPRAGRGGGAGVPGVRFRAPVDIADSRHHDAVMRTTLTLDDDVYRAAKAMADAQAVSLGAVVSDLARRAMVIRAETTDRGGFPVFRVRPDAAPITLDDVQRALDEE